MGADAGLLVDAILTWRTESMQPSAVLDNHLFASLVFKVVTRPQQWQAIVQACLWVCTCHLLPDLCAPVRLDICNNMHGTTVHARETTSQAGKQDDTSRKVT
jgi:hypothetical protein